MILFSSFKITGRVEKFLLITLTLLIFLLPTLILTFSYDERVSGNPVILFVGDFSQGGYGVLVEDGITTAINRRQSSSDFRVRRIDFNEPRAGQTDGAFTQGSYDSRRLKDKIIDEIVASNVVAIISANTSSTAQDVIEVSSTFRIPLFLTVATNDDLLSNSNRYTFRMVPSDSLQSSVISEWCNSTNTIKGTNNNPSSDPSIALVYDPRQYGTHLQSLLKRRVGHTSIVSFPLGVTEETTGIIERGSSLGVKKWVFLGYRSQASDFYAKMFGTVEDKPLLMSDGGYGTWLKDVPPSDSLFISFPYSKALDNSSTGHVNELTGFSPFGYDSVRIIGEILQSSTTVVDLRANIQSTVQTAANRLNDRGLLTQEYSFNKSGESTKADFRIYHHHDLDK